MERILEPELMEAQEQVLAYAQADFSASNRWFVERVAGAFAEQLGRVIDLGCGPGDVTIRLARACPEARITAIDGSAEMIRLAEEAVRVAGLGARIETVRGRLPGLPFEPGSYDAVLSKDLLHHLPDPQVLWREVRRLGRPGAAVCVMDLFRPPTLDAARRIVEDVAGGEHPILKEDFFNSLCAAFTLDEVRAQLREAGLALAAEPVSERHLLVWGRLP